MPSNSQVPTAEILGLLYPPEVEAVAADDSTDLDGIRTRLHRLIAETRWTRRIDGSTVRGHFAVVKQETPTAFAIDVARTFFDRDSQRTPQRSHERF